MMTAEVASQAQGFEASGPFPNNDPHFPQNLTNFDIPPLGDISAGLEMNSQDLLNLFPHVDIGDPRPNSDQLPSFDFNPDLELCEEDKQLAYDDGSGDAGHLTTHPNESNNGLSNGTQGSTQHLTSSHPHVQEDDFSYFKLPPYDHQAAEFPEHTQFDGGADVQSNIISPSCDAFLAGSLQDFLPEDRGRNPFNEISEGNILGRDVTDEVDGNAVDTPPPKEQLPPSSGVGGESSGDVLMNEPPAVDGTELECNSDDENDAGEVLNIIADEEGMQNMIERNQEFQEEADEEMLDNEYNDTVVRSLSPQQDDPEGNEDVQAKLQECPWELRPTARDKAQAFGTWLDQDQSGDYDPDAKAPVRPPQRPPRPVAARRESTNDGYHPRKRPRTAIAIRQSGSRCVVVLKLTSDAGRELLKKYPDNWPDDEHINRLRDDSYAADESSSNSDLTRAYRLRRRNNGPHCYSSDDEDFTGRPEGRGCKACHALGQHCSMRDPDGAYPCDACEEDGEDCEPLVEPLQKQACELCRRRGVGCSYNYTSINHNQPCRGCQQSNIKCVAGPALNKNRVRIGDDGKPAIPVDKGSRLNFGRYRSCAQCRREGRKCELLKTKDEPPCPTCKAKDIPCTFEAVKSDPKASHSKLSAPAASPSETHAKETAIEANSTKFTDGALNTVRRKRQRTSGVAKTIHTALSHPITFNTIQDDVDSLCHWCVNSNPMYPLYGHVGGWKPVKVIACSSKLGCKEVWNEQHPGYTFQGREPSRMCALCTFTRVKVMFCKVHVFRKIKNIDPNLAAESMKRKSPPALSLQELFKTKANVRHLTSREDLPEHGRKMRDELNKWCAICPFIATKECCAGVTDGAVGCGLKLCHMCHTLLVSQQAGYNGNLVRFVREIRNHVEQNKALTQYYPKGLRADHEFFTWEGYLMRQVRRAHMEGLKKAEMVDNVGKAEPSKPLKQS